MTYPRCYKDKEAKNYYRVHLDDSLNVWYINPGVKRRFTFTNEESRFAAREEALVKYYDDITDTDEGKQVIESLEESILNNQVVYS